MASQAMCQKPATRLRHPPSSVMPTKVGIQNRGVQRFKALDSGFRRDDGDREAFGSTWTGYVI